ncbi:MAG TPA: hypothetical protein VIG73_09105 [Cerasibacillus sp.]|uniref:hypothetical protein n=1 Tax=Cerasibacillus sp. TaxID=2498711 RepID=UPI002F3F5B53
MNGIASIEKADNLISEWIQEMSRVLDEKRIKHRGMINSAEQLNETTNELDTSSQQENEHIEQKTEQEENENIKHGDDTDNHVMDKRETSKQEQSNQKIILPPMAYANRGFR